MVENCYRFSLKPDPTPEQLSEREILKMLTKTDLLKPICALMLFWRHDKLNVNCLSPKMECGDCPILTAFSKKLGPEIDTDRILGKTRHKIGSASERYGALLQNQPQEFN